MSPTQNENIVTWTFPKNEKVSEGSLPYNHLLENGIIAPTDIFEKLIVTTSVESLSIYLALH